MADVHDVAAYILERQGAMTTMKLQKLCFYCQGWHLAFEGVPLFPQEFQAWANGPVCPDLFRVHRGKFRVDAWPDGDPKKLDFDEVSSIDAVLESHGPLTAQQLSDMSHRDRPWVEAREGLAPGQKGTQTIDLETMQDYFGALNELSYE